MIASFEFPWLTPSIWTIWEGQMQIRLATDIVAPLALLIRSRTLRWGKRISESAHRTGDRWWGVITRSQKSWRHRIFSYLGLAILRQHEFHIVIWLRPIWVLPKKSGFGQEITHTEQWYLEYKRWDCSYTWGWVRYYLQISAFIPAQE